MGDRCYVYITFHGKISHRAAQALVEVLNEQGYVQWDCNASARSALEPAKADLAGTFECEEVNYARIDEIEAVCSEHGIDFDMEHTAGGGYAAGRVRFVGGERRECTGGDGPMIPLSMVLETETLASGLGNLIALARFMLADLPPLEVAPPGPVDLTKRPARVE